MTASRDVRIPSMKSAAIVFLVSFAACGPASTGDALLDPDAGRSACTRTDSRVGWFADLSTRAHGVRGRVTLTDACTLTVSDFFFDGGGLDVRLVLAGAAQPFSQGTAVGPQLLKAGGYQQDTLLIGLRDDLSASQIERVSVWCVSAAVDFGSGDFRAP